MAKLNEELLKTQFDEDTFKIIEEWVQDKLKSRSAGKLMRPVLGVRTIEGIIAHVREHGIMYDAYTLRNAVLGGIEVPRKKGAVENLLKIGCASYGTILMVRYYCLLLHKLGIEYAFLEKEYCCLATATLL